MPPDHPVWDVWTSIRQTYPGPTANWEEEPSIEWAYALEGLTQEQIAKGLKTMVLNGGEFPPSAPSFRELCGANDWEHSRQSVPAHIALSAPIIDRGEGARLPAPADDRTPAEFMAAMKEAFK